jgi:hypothetical protein
MRKTALKKLNPTRHKGFKNYREIASEKGMGIYTDFRNDNGTITKLNFNKKILTGGFLFGESPYRRGSYQKRFSIFIKNMFEKIQKKSEVEEKVEGEV